MPETHTPTDTWKSRARKCAMHLLGVRVRVRVGFEVKVGVRAWVWFRMRVVG